MKNLKYFFAFIFIYFISNQGISQSTGYVTHHPCHNDIYSGPCATLTKIKSKTNKDLKVINIPHRGLWEAAALNYNLYSNNKPENSWSAYNEAAKEGFKSIEIDVTFTKDQAIAVIHEYALGRLVEGFNNSNMVWDTYWSQLEGKKLKRTNGTLTNSTIRRFDRVINQAKANNLVVYVDIKESQKSGVNRKESFKAIMRKCFVKALEKGALKNLIFKVPYSILNPYELSKVFDGDAGTHYGHTFNYQSKDGVLYMPVFSDQDLHPDPNGGGLSRKVNLAKQYAGIIDEYEALLGNRIISYELNIKNDESLFTVPFVDDDGYQRSNLFTHIYFKWARKPAFFATEPLRFNNNMPQVVNRFAQWNNIVSWDRSRFYLEIKQAILPHYFDKVLITTDKPFKSRVSSQTNLMATFPSSLIQQDSLPNFMVEKSVLYPNPVEDYISIKFPDLTEIGAVAIYDLNGKLVNSPNWTEGYTKGNLNLVGLDQVLTTGIYFIKIYDPLGKLILQEKLIKK